MVATAAEVYLSATEDDGMADTPYAERIKSMRLARAWSQEHLATVAGITSRTIQRAEKGELIALDSLMAIAAAFKIDVAELTKPELAAPGVPTAPVHFLLRVQTGTDLFKIVGASNAYLFDQDELDSPEDVELVASFLQDLFDWGEIWSIIEVGERVRVMNEYTPRIRELEARGLWVFGTIQDRPLSATDTFMLQVAVVCVTRPANPAIVHLNQAGDMLPTAIKAP